jgi:quinol monooxygenase YgiN
MEVYANSPAPSRSKAGEQVKPAVREDIMANLTVVAKLVVRRECVDAVKGELLKLVAATRLEPGCIEYSLHQDNDDPALFIFYETWENEGALAGHLGSPHFQAYLAAVEGMIVEKSLNRMTEIP